MTTTDELILHWHQQSDATLRPPASKDAISQFESANRILIPDGFRSYLTKADGFDQSSGYQDENGYNFWPLEKIAPATTMNLGSSSSKELESLFVFAGYLDFCWGYAIRLRLTIGDNEIAILGTASGVPQTIAANFDEFLQLYISEDEKMQPD